MEILLCTDCSYDGLKAVRLGVVIASQLGAQVTILCVVEDKRSDLDKKMKRVDEALPQSFSDFSIVARRGQLIDEMLAQLLQTEYDLVIVGYHSRGFLKKALWGSLAARIAHELPLSVLIVRGRRDWINHVLVGISGRGFTEECVDWGGRIALAFGGRVTLLHASAAPPLMYSGLEEVVETLAEFLETDTPEAQALKKAVTKLDDLGVEADVELARGLAEREILREAQLKDVDLIVIGSSWAAEPVHRVFVRNITEQILLNTKRPVLVVRPAGQSRGMER
jgi:nucleotide-binding universal stress UspA family protein